MSGGGNLNGSEARGKCIDEDLCIGEYRHPVIYELEQDLMRAKPLNTLHFIKRWAMRKMKESDDSDEEDEMDKTTVVRLERSDYRRRAAVVMRDGGDSDLWSRLTARQPVTKNEECKSRIMLGLRSIPFLAKLNWQSVEQILKQFYEGDTLINKGDQVDLMYVLISGQVVRQSAPFYAYNQGEAIFAETLISPSVCKHPYSISSQKAQVCALKAFQIHELARIVNQQHEQQVQKLLMRIPSFACLDAEQLYKAYLLVKETRHKVDDVVIEKGSQVGRVFLVISGEVAMCRVSLEGSITAFQSFKEGTVFGEEWLITTNEAQHTVIARTPTILGSIDKKEFEASITKIGLLLLRKKSRAHRYE